MPNDNDFIKKFVEPLTEHHYQKPLCLPTTEVRKKYYTDSLYNNSQWGYVYFFFS